MAEMARYVCPNCNGVLQFSSDKHEVTCEFCGGTFAVEDLKAPEVGDEKKVQLESAEHESTVEGFLKRAPWSESEGKLVSHTCNTCGAEIVCDQATVTTNCPYCGNVMIASSTLAGRQPDAVIPFKVNRNRAKQVMAGHVTGKWYLPKEFAAELQHIQGVYVPYYLYSASVNGWAWYDGEKDKTVGSGDDRRVITKHSDVYRAAESTFVRVSVDGSSKMPDGHMDAIEPFDFDELQPFNIGYLAGYLAEVPDETEQDCWPRAEDRCVNTFESKLQSDACRHVDRVTRKNHDTTVKLDKVESTLIPVWLMHCTWEKENMLFAVNGQTGRIVGDMPYSSGKRTGTIVVSLLVAIILSVLFLFVLSDDGPSAGSLGVAAVVCIVLPMLVDGFFMGQVRSANVKHEAEDAVRRGDFQIVDQKG